MSTPRSSTLLLALLALAGTVGANQLVAGYGPNAAEAAESGTEIRFVGPAKTNAQLEASRRAAASDRNRGLLGSSEIKLLPATLGQMSARSAAKPPTPVETTPASPKSSSTTNGMLGQSLLGSSGVASTPRPSTKPPVVASSPTLKAEPRYAPKPAPPVAVTAPAKVYPSQDRYSQTNSAQVATAAQPVQQAAAKKEVVLEDPFMENELGSAAIVSDMGKAPSKETTSPPTPAPQSTPRYAETFRLNEQAIMAAAHDASKGQDKPVATTSSNPTSQSRYAIENAFPKLSLLDTTPAKPESQQVATHMESSRVQGSRMEATRSAVKPEPRSDEKVSVAFSPKPESREPESQDLQFQAPSRKSSESNNEVKLAQSQSSETNAAYSATTSQGSLAATAYAGGEVPASTPYPERAKIVFRPAVVDVNKQGRPVLRPDVKVANRQTVTEDGVAYVSGGVEGIPPVEGEVIVPEDWSAPVVADPSGQYAQQCQTCEPRLGPCHTLALNALAELNGPCGCDPRLGAERVVFAPSFVDTTQPLNNFRLRLDTASDYQAPDRAEYFWARIGADGRGPEFSPERQVDYQEIEAYMEVGGDAFSVGTSIPIMMVDPAVNPDHAGLGDITITTKTKFLDGKHWQISNLFRVYIPSGDAAKGLGTGHTSLEPGFAWRYKWSDVTYFHGDLKYWFPLGGDNLYEGEVLTYGIAMSHVWSETDCWAIMPTFEIVGYSFVGGLYTDQFGIPIPVDSDGIINVHPGIRFARDKGSDCGIQEFGLFGGIALSEDTLYEEILRFELRWSW